MFKRALIVLLTAVCVLQLGACGGRTKPKSEVSLLGDPGYKNGFVVSPTGKGNEKPGGRDAFDYMGTASGAYWNVSQHSCNKSLYNGTETFEDGFYTYTDAEEPDDVAKTVRVNPTTGEISLNMLTSRDYTAPRQGNEAWCHLLIDTGFSGVSDSVVTVYNGLIKAKSTGKATVTAYAQSTRDNGRGMNATIEVTVYPDDSLGKNVSITANDTAAITGTLWATNASGCNWTTDGVAQPNAYMGVTVSGLWNDDNIIYKSSDPNIVSVNTVGKLVGISAGRAYVTATTKGGISKSMLVTVGTPAGTAVTGLTASGGVALTASEPLKTITATVAPADATEGVLFTSSDKSVVMPASDRAVRATDGLVSMDVIAVGNGTATITAASAGGETCAYAVTVSGYTPSYDDERTYRDNDYSKVAPEVSIDMPDKIIRNWKTRVNYSAQTTNPDVNAPLKTTVVVSSNGFNFEIDNDIFTPTSFGVILVRVKAEDEFGNYSFASKTLTIINGAAQSTIAPAVEFDMQDKAAVGSNVQIKYAASSDNPHIPTPHIITTEVSVNFNGTNIATTKTGDNLFFTPDAAGEYVISVTAADEFGNKATESFTVTAEVQNLRTLTVNAPEEISDIKIDGSPANASYADGTYALTFTVDSGYKAEVKVNGVAVAAVNGEYSVSITANTTVAITVSKTDSGCMSSAASAMTATLLFMAIGLAVLAAKRKQHNS